MHNTSVFMTINTVTTELNFDGSTGKAIPAGTDRKSCVLPPNGCTSTKA